MRIVGILTLWALLVFANIANADVHGFKTIPWQDCTRESECKVLEPKEWATHELSFLDETLSEFKRDGLNSLIQKVISLNFSLQRTAYWQYVGFAPEHPLGTYFRNEFVHAVTIRNSNKSLLVFSDRFFNSQLDVDHISNVDFKKITLLHELVHAYDSEAENWSTSIEFRKLAGFSHSQEAEFNQPIYVKATPEELDKVDRKIKELLGAGKELEAHNIDREFGMALGLPRYYSTTTPHEAFADIVTFIFFDKNAETYLSPELISFIDMWVLKGARALP